jgi:hypothetical protein
MICPWMCEVRRTMLLQDGHFLYLSANSMSHERGQRTPGTPGKDAAAASSSPSRKKTEYMTGVMPPGINTENLCSLLFLAFHLCIAGLIVYHAPEPIKAPEKNPLCKTVTEMSVTLKDGTVGKCVACFIRICLDRSFCSSQSLPGTLEKSSRAGV